MDDLFKETAHFNIISNEINTEPSEKKNNKKIKKNHQPTSTKINKNIKYNLIDESNNNKILKNQKRPSSQRQKLSFNNNINKNNIKNEKEKKNNISTQRKVEKELNNLILSLPTEFYKDAVIKSKLFEIMKNIDEIKQVVNKKSVMKKNQFIPKQNEKLIIKDKKIHKSNLIQPRK